MNTIYYTLPSDWACYFVNGDDSGLERHELKAIRAIERELINTGYSACALDCEEGEGEFKRYHDACHVYPYAANCLKITFPEAEKETKLLHHIEESVRSWR